MNIPHSFQPNSKHWGVVVTTHASTAAVVGVLAVALSAGSASKRKAAEMGEGALVSSGIADSAIQMATSKFWRDYRAAKENAGPQGLSPDEFLDNQGLVTQVGKSDIEKHDYLPELGVHQDGEGAYPLAGGYVRQLEITCKVTPTGHEVEFTSLASMGEGTLERGARRVYNSAGHSKEE
ncbi:MAG: hypothetical protein GY930_05980 [bacterium]|nr:hypothetical protein [bacterium]